MRIMCVFVSLTIFLALGSGCLTEKKCKKVDFRARKTEPLRKKAGAEGSLKRGRIKTEKLRHSFPILKNILRRLLDSLGLAHLEEEQVRELFKKLIPLIKQRHRLEEQINKLEAEAEVLMKQSRAEFSRAKKSIHVLERKVKNRGLTSAEYRRIETKCKELERLVKMADAKNAKATILRLKGVLLKYSLSSLDDQVESISATYRKKKRDVRTNP